MPAVKAGTENPGFLFLKDLVVFHRCSHVIETAALIQIYILQRADQGSITFEMNERIVTHTAGHKGRILFIDALLWRNTAVHLRYKDTNIKIQLVSV